MKIILLDLFLIENLCHCFMLEFFCGHTGNENILESLCAKKKSLFLNLQTASKAGSLMKKNNMESVILSGIKIPYVDKVVKLLI